MSEIDTLAVQYSAVKNSIATLEEEKKRVAENILEALKKEDKLEHVGKFGKIWVVQKKLWTYSTEYYTEEANLKDEIDVHAKAIKKLQAEQQADGRGDFEIQPILNYRAAKE